MARNRKEKCEAIVVVVMMNGGGKRAARQPHEKREAKKLSEIFELKWKKAFLPLNVFRIKVPFFTAIIQHKTLLITT